MELKRCSICKTYKPYSEFTKHRNKKYGLQNECKKCRPLLCKKWRKGADYYIVKRKESFDCFVNEMYKNTRKRILYVSKFLDDKNFVSSYLCTKDEFLKLAYSSNSLKELFNDWVDGGFGRRLVPSVDRIDHKRGYLTDNIQFLTHSENCRKGNLERYN